ncbi:AraC family transcriptional regulator of adaptative response / DNA-3-methyladenine glycosylase II [Crossiella equi]|uniref:AraC family transcriptional regulator of adaptative response / DNA-3-methyladenine glycosylase II n=1 Tax=Crossiella equi TaxID=130796 RepID=A0ABS5AIP1_9PSEU|nr:AlkA N-terminal domain-containing protein [Crossiella equi]MBP2476416.1 AraC family transcriptional regulator of adaptative response / DNA-3-methyladenine glycosylase II [Crossiella equi]
MLLDPERAHRIVAARDARFDGCFFFAVRTTGIYCRPSCPAVTPKRQNVEFHPTAASAQAAGFRACRRCLPDAVPGSPEWDLRADLAARAMRLITDGVVEREGVSGLAARLGYSERHLSRVLAAELGAGPLALARAHRAHSARLLIETTELGFAEVAFAAGFASVRQFNDTIRAVFAVTPTALRAGSARCRVHTPGVLHLRLPFRPPLDAAGLLASLAASAVPGVEHVTAERYGRTLRLAHGVATVWLTPGPGHVACELRLSDLRDLGSAVARLRRLLDLDADPQAVDGLLGTDPLLAPLVAAAPGLRVPGSVDGAETVLRALAAPLPPGEPLSTPDGPLTALFPTPAEVAAVAPGPVREVALALADGTLSVHAGRDAAELTADLLAYPAVSPALADLVVTRVLGAPDVWRVPDPALTTRSRAWRPWRSYATAHLLRAQGASNADRRTA